jgi:hypothetical protein
MEPQAPAVQQIVIGREFVTGVYGTEVVGGADDGTVEPKFVLVQMLVSPFVAMTEDAGTAPQAPVYFGFTRAAALALAEGLRASAEQLPTTT